MGFGSTYLRAVQCSAVDMHLERRREDLICLLYIKYMRCYCTVRLPRLQQLRRGSAVWCSVEV